jgi:hypothetical protein
MRLVTVKSTTDLNALGAQLQGAAGVGTPLASVQALNPHLDLNRLKPGDLLLLPDAAASPAPSAAPAAAGTSTAAPAVVTAPLPSQSLGGSGFADFAAEITKGLAAAATRARAGTDTATASRTALSSALRGAAIQRAIGADPQLQKQLDDADAQLKADLARAQAAGKQVELLQKGGADALALFGKRVG